MTKPTDEADFQIPRFLYGTFDWHINGLHFDSEPTLDLLDPVALEDPNPWIVLAAVLAHAKAGDHTCGRRLANFLHTANPFSPSKVAFSLVGDMASDADLVLLQEAMASTDAEVREQAARGARLAGRLWLVPAMLEAWHRAPLMQHREGIGFAISDLLESDAGAIAEEASIYNLPRDRASAVKDPRLREFIEKRAARELRPERFPELVKESYERLRDQFGTDRITVWHGGLLDVTALARQFLSSVQSDKPAALTLSRHKFEALTGTNCGEFFIDVRPQLLAMQATLEEFLASDPAARFEPGIRYFFGHRID